VNAINALGFVEVYGLAAGIEAADAMAKSAPVGLLREFEVRAGLVTLTVEGDLAACRAAVDAGVAAAARIGTVIAQNVIGRPDADTENLILDVIPRPEPAPPGDQPVVSETDEFAETDEVLAFIAGARRGRSAHEVAKRFPDYEVGSLHAMLEALVASGGLNKVGARYRKA
jgi:ethanolamine utilization protein EutK